MRSFIGVDLAALLLLLLTPALGHPRRPGLPVVDLGYEVHQAISYNETTQLYNFSNIRYAQAPVGNLRWAAPQPPQGRNSTVTTGPSSEPICPQSAPLWYVSASEFSQAIESGTVSTFNYTLALEHTAALVSAALSSLTSDSRQTEDCLFLDVVVPAKIFNAGRAKHGGKKDCPGNSHTGGAPVVIWIFGGGYVGGWKTSQIDPRGLIKASDNNIIFVGINYRLGALGFMAGDELKKAGGVANAAFHDQRLAIEWVHNNIHLFGGDKNRITLLGASAGGGSIVHQITAYGGQRPVHFQQAIPQSPAWAPNSAPAYGNDAAATFLKLLNVSTFEEARTLNSSVITLAQIIQVATSPYGRYAYGPTVDGPGGFVPKIPGQLLAEGQFARNVKILSGHNTNEAAASTHPLSALTSDIRPYVVDGFPSLSNETVDYIVNDLYPPVFDGTYPWTDNRTRAAAIIADSGFTCNNNYLNKAYGNKTWAYEFQVPPAFHGYDGPYTFWDGSSSSDTFSTEVAAALQGYIVNFAIKGDPNAASLPTFPIQGHNASMNGLNTTFIGPQRDPTSNQRCVFWQHAFDT